ncbi:hypothetical protein KEM52_000796 [Ascosphaera acerosa]|nr:hypothetical protein KEM52_000796 [Ascosphaera acerosa]
MASIPTPGVRSASNMLLVQLVQLVLLASLAVAAVAAASEPTYPIVEDPRKLCVRTLDKHRCWFNIAIDNHRYGSAKQQSHHTTGELFDALCGSISDRNLLWDGFRLGSRLREDVLVLNGTLRPTPAALRFAYAGRTYPLAGHGEESQEGWWCARPSADPETLACWTQFAC